MSAPDLDVRYVADLARMRLSDDEVEKFQSQLSDILEYVNKLETLDVSNIEPTAHAQPLSNVVRADEERPSLPQDDALASAPQSANGLIILTKVVEQA